MALSLVVGLCLLGLGFWGELAPPCWWPDWWHKLGYGLNIFASATGFLIGVPIALVFLETIKSNAAQQAQIDQVNRISEAAWSEFSKAIDELCSDERVGAVNRTNNASSATDQVQAEHDIIIERLEASRAAIRSNPNKAMDEIADLKTFLATHATTFEDKRKAVDKQFGTRHTLRPKWNYVLSSWRVLDEHVRVRRLEFELAPMSQESYTNILDKLSSDDDNNLFEFLHVHSGGAKSAFREGGITSMTDLAALIDISLEMPADQLANILTKHYNEWIGSSLKHYWTNAFGAYLFLTSLKMSVESVATRGWPGNATKPKR